MSSIWAVLCLYGVFSLWTLILFWFDKYKSIKAQNRISEKTLLLSCVFGGSLGALLGIYWLRHKSQHFYFVLIAWQSLVLQGILLGLLICLKF